MKPYPPAVGKLFQLRAHTMRLPLSFVQKRCTSYSSTVLLPKTTFEQRISAKRRAQHERKIAADTGFSEHYSWQRGKGVTSKGEFILHDGPPYANGQLHLGHAVNKILKDITCRHQALSGLKVNYTPGWDCHGLPIEAKAIGEGESMDPLKVREKARHFALKTIVEQRKDFKDWGIMADWDNNIYRTLDPSYVVNQLRAFCTLYEKGLIFRDTKPVYWSPSNRTALAEAELEYNPQHESTAVYLKFPIERTDYGLPREISALSALVWTTTPWTLLANQAVCFSPKLQYAIVRRNQEEEALLICAGLREALQAELNCELNVVVDQLSQELIAKLKYTNTLTGKQGAFLPGSFVTNTQGSGLVHSAPNHGQQDYVDAISHGLKLDPCLVDELGRYNELAGELRGLDVLTEGNQEVVKRLQAQNVLVHVSKYVHSYPYDWRTRKPVLVRSSQQWFIDLSSLKVKAVDVLENEVEVVPESAKKMFVNQLSVRPHWCISRQRSWGVPIPVHFGDDGTPHIDRAFVEKVCEAVERHGTDFWFRPDAAQLLQVDGELGTDIMDIWLDSGLSWNAVLGGKQADLYLEGVDQVRGWFQSSLLTSVALTGRAPYKKLFLHGFVLDSERQKLSKSLGNIISPSDIVEGEGALGLDVLRWWVALHAATSENIFVSKKILAECESIVSKIRNSFKFILGNRANGDSQRNSDYSELMALDKALLHRLCGCERSVRRDYERMDYSSVCKRVSNFLITDVSAVYMHAIKNRLYCHGENSPERRSACTALQHLGFFLVRCLAPIVPHLSAEVLSHCQLTLHRDDLPQIEARWENQRIGDGYELLLKCREELYKQCGVATPTATVTLILKTNDLLDGIQDFQQDSWSQNSSLTDLFQCSKAILVVGNPPARSLQVVPGVSMTIEGTREFKCPRCRRSVSEEQNKLCSLCGSVLAQNLRRQDSQALTN